MHSGVRSWSCLFKKSVNQFGKNPECIISYICIEIEAELVVRLSNSASSNVTTARPCIVV